MGSKKYRADRADRAVTMLIVNWDRLKKHCYTMSVPTC